MKEVKHTRLAMTAMTSILALGLGSGAMAAEPQEGTGTASARISDGGITPYIIFPDRAGELNNGGNRTCEGVGDAFLATSITTVVVAPELTIVRQVTRSMLPSLTSAEIRAAITTRSM